MKKEIYFRKNEYYTRNGQMITFWRLDSLGYIQRYMYYTVKEALKLYRKKYPAR